jgi:hypothetical protein
MGVAEDQNKVENILLGPGAMNSFTELYAPLLREAPFATVVAPPADDHSLDRLQFACVPDTDTHVLPLDHLRLLSEAVPAVVASEVGGAHARTSTCLGEHGSWVLGTWWEQATLSQRREHIRQRVASVVRTSSR